MKYHTIYMKLHINCMKYHIVCNQNNQYKSIIKLP